MVGTQYRILILMGLALRSPPLWAFKVTLMGSDDAQAYERIGRVGDRYPGAHEEVQMLPTENGYYWTKIYTGKWLLAEWFTYKNQTEGRWFFVDDPNHGYLPDATTIIEWSGPLRPPT